MKKSFSIATLIVFGLAGFTVSAQELCKVMLPQISGSYEGDCKKGLAHGQGKAKGTDQYEGQFRNGLPDGKGTYLWSTGEKYTGQWKNGKRNGIGEYTFPDNGKDTTSKGQWLDDKYVGPVVPKPEVKQKDGIDRYSFQKNGDLRKRVLLNFYQNGMRNTNINNLLLSSSSGYETTLGISTGYDEVTFPVTIKISYITVNKLNTMPVNVIFEFEISEPGDWVVDIHN